MVAATGTPIRLVHENGALTELDATNIAFTTNRKTGPIPTPFAGGIRVGIDMNMNGGLIVINGVFTDDKTIVGTNNKSSSLIDFATTHGSTSSITGVKDFISVNNYLLTLFNSTYVSGGDTFSNATLWLTASDGSNYTIKFKKLSSGTFDYTTGNSSYEIGIYPGSVSLTRADFATALVNLITNTSTLAAKFTATAGASPLASTAGNCRVTITQVVAGSGGNNVTPRWLTLPSQFEPPYTTDFSGGFSAKKRSAGDKAMDLYGIMNNSKKGGWTQAGAGAGLIGLGGIIAVTTAGPTLGMGVGVGVGIAATGAGIISDAGTNYGDAYGGDYIVGIQIPYNSSIQANGATYVARNFFMPTGFGETRITKGSEGNNLAASTSLLSKGNRAGIKGTVNKIDITYDAGETVYGFILNFVPVDFLA